MKLFSLIVSVVLFATSVIVSAEEHFKIKEYKEFHHLLHMLQHEALPQNDLKTIRAKAEELVKLGDAVVKLGVPKEVKAEHVEGFKTALNKFEKSLGHYGHEAKSGSDNTMKNAYLAVHDSFEELADMLPRS